MIVLVPVRLTACPKVRGLAPDTVTFAPTWMRVELVKTRLVNGLVFPTAPVKLIVPAPATKLKALAPLSVLLKPILVPFEVTVLVPVKLTGKAKVRGLAPLTVTFAAT